MTPRTCGLTRDGILCAAPASWQLTAGCECIEYRCDPCRDLTLDVIASARAAAPRYLCKHCERVIDLSQAKWTPLDVDSALAAAVESIYDGVRFCATGGCYEPATWLLVAPCGHVSGFCNSCHPDTVQIVARLAAEGEPFVCALGDGDGWWAEFTWSAIR